MWNAKSYSFQKTVAIYIRNVSQAPVFRPEADIQEISYFKCLEKNQLRIIIESNRSQSEVAINFGPWLKFQVLRETFNLQRNPIVHSLNDADRKMRAHHNLTSEM